MPERLLGDFLTPSQTARELGITPQRVTQIAVAGRLAFLPTPLGRLFARADVERLAAERRRLLSAGARGDRG